MQSDKEENELPATLVRLEYLDKSVHSYGTALSLPLRQKLSKQTKSTHTFVIIIGSFDSLSLLFHFVFLIIIVRGDN